MNWFVVTANNLISWLSPDVAIFIGVRIVDIGLSVM